MGWSVGWKTRKALLERLSEPAANESILSQRCIDNVLWQVVLRRNPLPPLLSYYIRCTLIQRDEDPPHRWGYKVMCEADHPLYYNCPLSYLAQVPDASPQWRARVCDYHRRMRSKSKLFNMFNEGTFVQQVQCDKPYELEVVRQHLIKNHNFPTTITLRKVTNYAKNTTPNEPIPSIPTITAT